MKQRVKKRTLYLSLGIIGFSMLFALFQNFECLSDTEEALRAVPEQTVSSVVKKMSRIEFFRPYFFREHIGNLETPFGYREAMKKPDGPIVFDDRKYLDDKWHASPLYNQTKNFFDFSSSSGSQDSPECIQDPRAQNNNCYANYNNNYSDSNNHSGGSMRLRANPFRRMASLSYDGQIDSQLLYDEGQKSVNLELTKKINTHSNLNLEMKSQDQSGQINIDWKW